VTSAEDCPEWTQATPPPEVDADAVERVRRARDGDHEAFAALVAQHERMVLRTALGLLGRLHDAQDAAQETFLRMHKHLRRFDDSRDLRPWLYRIVVNACRDIARRRSSASLLPLEAFDEKPDETARFGPAEIEAAVSRAEQRRLIHAALATLPEKERAALVLRDIEGARILGSSEGTVRSQVCTARLKIRAFVVRQQERRG
jgi:RNA polymerase sigma-70 factor (ECF subfamily)